MRIGYLGPEGTLTQDAAERLTRVIGGDSTLMPISGLAQLMSQLVGTDPELGVLPAENALEGSVNATWDWLVFRTDLSVLGELVLPVRHCLIGHRAQKLTDVRTVLSHPQALAQCRDYLLTRLPQAQEYETVSTAEAARVVAVNRLPIVAIASRRAAGLYGLDVLAEDIQDVQENATRFILVGRTPLKHLKTGLLWKTSLVCTVQKDRPGSLRDILEVFAARQINLTRIESRPARKHLGDYIFLVDLEGHQEDLAVSGALNELRKTDGLAKILGSYPLLS